MSRYDQDFNPILLEDQTAILFGTGLPANGLNIKCIAVGAMPEHWVDFGALTANTLDPGNITTDLDMNTMELAQYRMRIVTEMRLNLKHPGAVWQWRSKNVTFYLPQFPMAPDLGFLQEYYWKASEFFLFEDNRPEFDLFANRAQLNAFVIFSGWRYKLQKIETAGRIPIWTSEWPVVSSTPRYPR